MKIAFASSDCTRIDEQFRRASNLVIYEITPGGQRLDRICAFPRDRAVRSQHRLDAIAGAAVVYVSAIGPSSAARLVAHGIRPATLPEGTTIARVLAAFAAAAGDPGCRA